MTKRAIISLSFLTALVLAACGDNIRPSEDFTDDGCLDGDCPVEVDGPDAGMPDPEPQPDGGASTPDAGDPVPTPDGGPATDGGSGSCGVCPEGQVCVDGTCVCDQDGDVPEAGCAPDEVRLCHTPPGQPEARHPICVGPNAAEAHQAHGDTLGDCP